MKQVKATEAIGRAMNITRVSARYQDLDTNHTMIAAPGVGYKLVLTLVVVRNASATSAPFTVLSDGAYDVSGLNELVGFKLAAGASGANNPNFSGIVLSENTELNVRNVTATGSGNPDVYIQVYYVIQKV